MAEHILKSWPRFFQEIKRGERTHELRRNDRNYTVGDYLVLREYDPETSTYTGEQLRVHVTSMTSAEMPCAVSDQGLHPEFCILSIVRRDELPFLRIVPDSYRMIGTDVHVALADIKRDTWKVICRSDVLNRENEWEYEPLPSSRDAEFLARTRFATVDEAFDHARKFYASLTEADRQLFVRR